MTQTITTDLSGLQDVLRKVAGDISPAIEAGLQDGAERLQERDLQEVQKTYNRPSHYTYKTKKGRTRTVRWKRTSSLKAGWTIHSSPLRRDLVMEGEAGKPITNYPGGYSQKLATLPISKDGKSRANPHAQNALKVVQPHLQEVIESKIKGALGI